MKVNNEKLNTARAVASNGQKFQDGAGTITGVYYGFTCGATCKISAITVANADGDTIDGTDPDWASYISTTNTLHGFISAGLVKGKNGYITSCTVSEGTANFHKDTMTKEVV
jgi:hypothetical protein